MKGFQIVFLCLVASSCGVLGSSSVTLVPSFNLSNVITADRLPLRSEGRFIVDKNGQRAKLACVNWYQAHLSLHAVGGLHVRNVTDIVTTIRNLGFNCIRLVFSLELIYTDPPVLDRALAANPGKLLTIYGYMGRNITGMQLFDSIVDELAAQDMLIVLNNHNSASGWCCSLDSEEGLWQTTLYSTDDWVEGLKNITARYASIPQVIGMDLRNEIHDFEDQIITWGTSPNKDTDWKVASELAGKAVLDANPDSLVIVTGLCSGFDIQLQVNDPPDIPDNRMVWTVHTYGYSVYWTLMKTQIGLEEWSSVEVPLIIVIVLSTLGLVTVLLRVALLRSSLGIEKHQLMTSLGAWSSLYGFLIFVAGFLWNEALRQARCSGLNANSWILIGIGVSWILISLFVLAYGCRLKTKLQDASEAKEDSEKAPTKIQHYSQDMSKQEGLTFPTMVSTPCCATGCSLLNWGMLSFFVLAFSSLGYWFALRAQTYEILKDELTNVWELDNPNLKHPIWVGEFGDASASDWFQNAVRFFKEEDLDYGYWAIDGFRWFEEYGPAGEWEKETYGILNEDYETLNQPPVTALLQSIQTPTS